MYYLLAFNITLSCAVLLYVLLTNSKIIYYIKQFFNLKKPDNGN